MSRVQFSQGTLANYKAITTKDTSTLYFTSDSHQIFIGDKEYTKGTTVLTEQPTSTTAGEIGSLYAYNGGLYLCTGYTAESGYAYTRVANINDTAGTVTSVSIGEGLAAADGTANPITATGEIKHAVPTGAAETADSIEAQTPDFGESFNIVGVATDKFGHAKVATHTVTLPTETAVTVETATADDVTLSSGGSFTVVTGVEVGAADQSVKRTTTKFTLPQSTNTTYTFATGDDEGKIKVTPSQGDAYQVLVKGWEDLAKKADISAIFKFKGTVATVADLPKTASVGDVYHVTEKSAEYVCITASTETTDAVYEELGPVIDLSAYAKSEDVIQRVKDAEGMVPKLTADGTLASTGFTLGVSVPADAKFTDTTYGQVTTTEDGLMIAADKVKLDAIAEGAQVNVLEGVQVDGTDLTIDANKKVNVTLSSFGVTVAAANINDVNNKLSTTKTDSQTVAGPVTFTSGITSAVTGDVTGNLTGDVTGNADTATKATQDASGNVITTTYATKQELTDAIAWTSFDPKTV